MSRQSKDYTGRFQAAPTPKKARRWVPAVLLVILVLARIAATGVKGLSLYDYYVGGDNILIYGNVRGVDFGDRLNSQDGEKAIQVIENEDAVPTGDEDYVIRLDNGKTLIYQGHTYTLNENLVTVLFMGIDRTLNDGELSDTEQRGQADVLLLIGIDTTTGKSTILNISRETYTQVDVYSINGTFIETRYEQIARAFGHGDGGEFSCENTRTAVSRLLYGLPISRYIALDMDGIQAANNAVGGVTLKSLFDFTGPNGKRYHKDDVLHLQGSLLDSYIRTRSLTDVDANAARMDRQVQYVKAFSRQVVSASNGSVTFSVDLFSALAPYMVTDLEIPDVTFLGSCYLDSGSEFTFRGLSGVYDLLGKNAVFYADDTDIFDAVLQIFYTQTA